MINFLNKTIKKGVTMKIAFVVLALIFSVAVVGATDTIGPNVNPEMFSEHLDADVDKSIIERLVHSGVIVMADNPEFQPQFIGEHPGKALSSETTERVVRSPVVPGSPKAPQSVK